MAPEPGEKKRPAWLRLLLWLLVGAGAVVVGALEYWGGMIAQCVTATVSEQNVYVGAAVGAILPVLPIAILGGLAVWAYVEARRVRSQALRELRAAEKARTASEEARQTSDEEKKLAANARHAGGLAGPAVRGGGAGGADRA